MEIKTLQSEMASLKRGFKTISDQQSELLQLMKSMKKGAEASQFDLAKCCHTVSYTNCTNHKLFVPPVHWQCLI